MDWLRDPAFGNIVAVLGLVAAVVGVVLARRKEGTPGGAETPPGPVALPPSGTPGTSPTNQSATKRQTSSASDDTVLGFWFFSGMGVFLIVGELAIFSGAAFDVSMWIGFLAAVVCAPLGAVIGIARKKRPLSAGRASGIFLSLLGGGVFGVFVGIFIAALIVSLLGASAGDPGQSAMLGGMLGYAAVDCAILMAMGW